jgi:phosphate transport system permease protein
MRAGGVPARGRDDRLRRPADRGAGRLRPEQAQGEPMLWLTGAALVASIAMIVGLLLFVLYQGACTFWPAGVVRLETTDGRVVLGEVTLAERYAAATVSADAGASPAAAVGAQPGRDRPAVRRMLRTGNYELTGTHFVWVADAEVASESRPAWAIVVERLTWGRFYGYPDALLVGGESIAGDPAAVWETFLRYHHGVRARWRERRRLERDVVGEINRGIEQLRLDLRSAEIAHGKTSPEFAVASREYEKGKARADGELAAAQAAIDAINAENAKYALRMKTADGREATMGLADIVRAYPANRLGGVGKLRLYLARWWEFLSDEPREANSEGGVFPAIFGTVVMTLVMSLIVTPLGVLAALYLREYAKAGPVVSAVRIAVNNLAGVPSIVFGVFGLGFFCYIIGGSIDRFLFTAKLPSPTYGTGGVLWASLTLALLTLPVVIVATEEALAAVPGSMREGSYACGASKWQTIRRIVLPRAMPGILTGVILAIARGAGEVAPLMLVGAVKLAPELPFDGRFPYLHLERSFMHLGFHIFDLGFQSQNSEAAKPMVYTTTLLLVLIVAVLNVAAVALRARLRRRFAIGHF